jgi:cell division septum initiation protein DivIVA
MKTFTSYLTEANAAALEKKIVRKAETMRNHLDRGIRGAVGNNKQAQKNVDAMNDMIKQYKDQFGDAAWKAFEKKQGWVVDNAWDFYA